MFPNTQTQPNPAADGAVTQGQQPSKPEFYTPDQYHGLRGAYEQKLRVAQAAIDEIKGKLDAADGQNKTILADLEVFKSRASAADELGKKYADLDAQFKQTASTASRLEVLLKYPEAIRPETLELVKNSTLAPEALEKTIGSLAQAFKASAVPPTAGSTPPQPAHQAVTSKDIMEEAYSLLRKNDIPGYQAKLLEAARLQDQTNGAFLPPIDNVNKAIGGKPPVG